MAASRKSGFAFVLLAFFGGLLFPLAEAEGRVVRVVVDRREDVLGGREWGEVGAYEKLVGRIFFAFDPENPANARVVDLALAPRNGERLVEAWANFMVLQPKDRARGRGIAWVEVSNRGGKATLRYFNRASTRSLDPALEADFGDGFLLRQGITLIWVGWQWDVPDQEGLLRLHVPVARLPGGSIQGLVRADWTVDQATNVLDLGHRNHRAYTPVDPTHEDNVLTVRDGRLAEREVVPRDEWMFVAGEEGTQAGQLTRIASRTGFEAGKIYELVYRAQNPRVVGLGLAAIRDVISYAKYELNSAFPVHMGVAFGVSQTGRFLRHFLYQGFNTDEGGRQAYDGLFIHTAGAGRGSFNHRFAQPSRDAHRYSAFFFPTDLFPFTSRTQADPASGREDGLFAGNDRGHLPLVFYTNAGYEYWGRAASLIHTSLDGLQDVEPQANERVYHLASGQHFVGDFPPLDAARQPGVGLDAYRGNPLDFFPTLRALASRMFLWVEGTEEPPESSFPRIDEGTLVSPAGLAFPDLPGLESPLVIHEAYRVDYGPRWWDDGVVDREPPEVGAPFPSLVSQVDGFGNELAGVRGVEVRVPLATYTPWNLRWGAAGGTEELTDFLGTYIPLMATEEGRRARGDPRPSVEALYASKEVFLERVRGATRALVREGFLLPEDAAGSVERAEAHWDWLMGQGSGPG